MAFASGRLPNVERQPRRFLQREVAGRPGIGMAEAEQQVDVGGPGPDAVQACQCGMRSIGRHRGEGIEIDLASCDGGGERFHGLDLGLREPEPRKLARPCAPQRVVMEGVERRGEASPDRAGARGRELLRAYDRAEPRKSGGTPPQTGPTGVLDESLQTRIGRDQGGQGRFEGGLVVEEVTGHWRGGSGIRSHRISSLPIPRWCVNDCGHEGGDDIMPACPLPCSDSRRARTAICISAMRFPR